MATDDEARARVKRTLLEAGVPGWAPFGLDDDLIPGRYYMWVVGGVVEGRLLIAPGADESKAVVGLLKACSDHISGDVEHPPRPTDLDAPTTLILLTSNGRLGNGRLGRIDADTLPLRTLLSLAQDALARQSQTGR